MPAPGTICCGCGQPFDRPLPICRAASCRAAVCRFCRDAEGVCLDCVRESASLAAYRAACEARDRDALVAVLLGGSRVDDLLLPIASCPLSGEPADQCEHLVATEAPDHA